MTAIRSGDTASLAALLREDPALARVRVVDATGTTGRSLLHVATDWPGHVPAVARSIVLLAGAGAEVDARLHGETGETPLHWAASSGDLEAIDALLDAGGQIDLAGASIADGTALTLATAFGLWDAAHHLVERGATSGLWEAAALGQLDRLMVVLDADPPPPEAVTGAFWGACHGGHLSTAAHLLSLGADPDWVGWDGLTPRAAARRAGAHDVLAWLGESGQGRGPRLGG